MPKISPIAPARLIRVFERLGLQVVRTRGGHVIMDGPSAKRPIVVPVSKSLVEPAIILSDLRSAGKTRDDYFQALEET